MIDFRLKTFLAVWAARSYTKAADVLCITQPAVSQQIRSLEEKFGTPLFRFVGRELLLTDAGVVLHRYASAADAEGRKTELRIASLGQSAPFRFGATRTIGEYVLPAALAACLKARPDAELSLVVDNTEALLRRLNRGDLDFAFIEGVFDREAFETTLVLRDAFLPVCGPLDSLATRGSPVDLVELLQRRLVVREQGSGSRVVLEHALAAFNIKTSDFHRVLELGNVQVIKEIVAEGLGVAFLYERSVRQELAGGRLSRIAVRDFSVFHDYSFVRLKNSVYEDSYREFLDQVLEHLGGQSRVELTPTAASSLPDSQ